VSRWSWSKFYSRVWELATIIMVLISAIVMIFAYADDPPLLVSYAGDSIVYYYPDSDCWLDDPDLGTAQLVG
jgi:hypothetical protein